MQINHRGADVAVAEEFLNRSDVIFVFKQMGCERMAKSVSTPATKDLGDQRAAKQDNRRLDTLMVGQ